jgi:hypothetical protein
VMDSCTPATVNPAFKPCRELERPGTSGTSDRGAGDSPGVESGGTSV